MAKKDAQVVAEEEFEEVDLGSSSQESRPISISASLTKKKKKKIRAGTTIEIIQRHLRMGL